MGIAYFLGIAWNWNRFALIVRVAPSHLDLSVSPPSLEWSYSCHWNWPANVSVSSF